MTPLMRRWTESSASMRGLLVGECLMLIAQMVGYVALPWWVTVNGGASALATYGVVMAVVALVCTPLLSPLGDRWPKRTQIIVGLFVLAACAALVAALALMDRFDLYGIIAVGALASLVGSLVSPASATIAAELVRPEKLPDALSLQKVAGSLGRILGPLIGGGIIATVGVAAALAAVPALLAMAAIAAFLIPSEPRIGQNGTRRAPRAWWPDLKQGLSAKWSIPIERGWTSVNFLVWVFLGPAVTMFIPLKIQSMGLSGGWFGAAETALSLGMMVGAVAGPETLVKRFGRYATRTFAAVAEGLFLVVAGVTESREVLLVALLFTGCANSMLVLVGQTHRMLAIPREFRVRMTAVNMTCTQVANMIGPGLAGVALLHLSLPTVYASFAAAAALFAAAFAIVPRSREFLSLGHDEVRDWYAREYPGAFTDRYALSAPASGAQTRRP